MPKRRRKKVAKRLPSLREQKGLTIPELARGTGLSENAILRAEAGEEITWRTCNLLANFLAVHNDVLLGAPDVWSPDYPEPDGSWEETVEEFNRRINV